jgi:hypothetical protein
VLGSDTAFGAIKFTAQFAHDGLKADWNKLNANVLIDAVVIGVAGWACLRKDRIAGRAAIGAAQAFGPLVARGHLQGTP